MCTSHTKTRFARRGRSLHPQSNPSTRWCAALLVAFTCLSGCQAAPSRSFSRDAAQSLLDSLAILHSRGMLVPETDLCSSPAEDGASHISQVVTEHLNSIDTLSFSCSVRRWETTTVRDRELRLSQGQDIVAWNRTAAWKDAVSIALFYDEEPRGDSLSRIAMAPLAGAVEALRSFMAMETPFDLPVVVSLSTTRASPVTPSWSPLLPHPTPVARYTTTVSSQGDSTPPTPLSTSRRSGWTIGVTSPHSAVAPAPNPTNPQASPESVGVVEPSTAFRLHAEHWINPNVTAPLAPEYYGLPFAQALQSIPLPGEGLSWSFLGFECDQECRRLAYWTLGIVLPLVFLALVACVVMIESSARVTLLRKSLKRQKKKHKRLMHDLSRDKNKLARLTMAETTHSQNVPERLSWNDRRKARRDQRRRNNLQQKIDDTSKQLVNARKRITESCRPWYDWKAQRRDARSRLSELTSGTWEMALDEVGGKAGAISMLCGLVAAGLSFLLLYSDLGTPSPADGVHWWTRAPLAIAMTLVVAVCLVMVLLGMGAARKRTTGSFRIRAFSIGAAAICSLGLNTIEMGPFSVVGSQVPLPDLYDSQVVTTMFACLILLLSIQEVVLHSRKKATRDRRWGSGGSYKDVVQSVTLDSEQRERRTLCFLGLSYLALACYTFGPAILEVIRGDQRPELVSVTAVGVVSVLVPLYPLVQLVRGGDSAPKRRGRVKDSMDKSVDRWLGQSGQQEEGR